MPFSRRFYPKRLTVMCAYILNTSIIDSNVLRKEHVCVHIHIWPGELVLCAYRMEADTFFKFFLNV
jgi:hypothetical protein